MIKTTVKTKNLVKTSNLIELINTYTLNFLNVYKKKHRIDLNFEITSKDISHFKVKIEGNIDGEIVKSSMKGDDLIPILEIVIRKLRNKSKVLNVN